MAGSIRVKGKTDELFSSLFHRRFVAPELAYSETTAYPANSLSLANKVAKLAVSTISDVRNTMFMCDFPKDHWSTLAPAMQTTRQAACRLRRPCASRSLQAFLGRGQPLCRRR